VYDNTPVAFTYADGWVRLKNVPITPLWHAHLGVKRAHALRRSGFLVDGEDEVLGAQRQHSPFADKAHSDTQNSRNQSAIAFETWKFLQDRDGAVSKAADWLQSGFDDSTWRTANNTPWNLQFDDLKDYSGVGLYRSLPFALPEDWAGRQVTVNMAGLIGPAGPRSNSSSTARKSKSLDLT